MSAAWSTTVLTLRLPLSPGLVGERRSTTPAASARPGRRAGPDPSTAGSDRSDPRPGDGPSARPWRVRDILLGRGRRPPPRRGTRLVVTTSRTGRRRRVPDGRRPTGTTWPGRPGQRLGEAEPAVLEHHRPEVAGVEQLDPDVRVELAEAAQLAVLLADEALLQRRHLEEDLEVRQVEVRAKLSTTSPSRFQRIGKVVGSYSQRTCVEVQDPGHLGLAGVGEAAWRPRRSTAPRPVALVAPDAWPRSPGLVARRSCRLLLRAGHRLGSARPRSLPRSVAQVAAPGREELVHVEDVVGGDRRRLRTRPAGRRSAPATTNPRVVLRQAAQSIWRKTSSSRQARRRSRSAGTRSSQTVHRSPSGSARRWSSGSIQPECTRSASIAAPGRRLAPDTPRGYHSRLDDDHRRPPPVDGATADHFRHSYTRDKAQLVRRLARIEGQVAGISRMIEREEYCVDILQQTSALRAAVDSLAVLVLEDHVQGCVRTAAAHGDADRYVEEVVDVVRRTLGRPVRKRRRALRGLGAPRPSASRGRSPRGQIGTYPRSAARPLRWITRLTLPADGATSASAPGILRGA